MEGWIKLHRKILESGFWMESEAVHLWIHLLIEASHKPRKTYFNGDIIELKEGQLITGRRKLSQETGISEQVIRKWLNIFEKNQQLTNLKTPVGSCISILNYSAYQEINQRPTNDQPTTNQPLTSRQPTINQRPTTIRRIKEGEELKNEKKGVVFTPPTPDQVRDYFFEIGVNGQEFERFHDYYQANGWKIGGKSKMKDWKASCRNWKKNIAKFNTEKNATGKKTGEQRMQGYRDWFENA